MDEPTTKTSARATAANDPSLEQASLATILEPLTPAQREAVEHVDGPLLMLAGPGSGKTRVITHRIAYLLHQGVSPRQILALTFTNKAADEMRLRLERLAPKQPVWLGTFHRFCARVLRRHAALVGLKENYSIYDAQDSRRAVKQAVKDLGLDLSHTSPERVASAISWAKNEVMSPEQYQARSGSAIGNIVERVYPEYQKQLVASNAVDFDDLLLYVARMFQENEELRQAFDDRFRYVLVDEYQDTNLAQYTIARAMSQRFPNLAVAGDPDQSIYGWRGANLDNILDFEHDYEDVRVVRLEQNWRSTPNILRVADQLISYNLRRKEKTLLTEREEGAPVRLVAYRTNQQEANEIVASIARQVAAGQRRLQDFAIFYRLNALSRTFENALRAHNMPYHIVKGLEFYQRKEIKDVLAYLQLINNPDNNEALRRIINTPPRKIGQKTIDHLSDHARRYGVSLLDAARECGLIESLSKQAKTAVGKFVAMYDGFRESATLPLSKIVRQVLDESSYHDWLFYSETEEDQDRLANIEELITDAGEFDQQHDDHGSLEEFLEERSLVSDTDNWNSDSDKVTLMTLHAAKGLEFPCAFIVAVEHGMLPHERAKEDPDQQEEERRLLFVGITRAEDELQLSWAKRRSFRGELRTTVPSSFLMELPRGEMEMREPSAGAAGAWARRSNAWNANQWEDDYSQDHPSHDEYDGIDVPVDSASATASPDSPSPELISPDLFQAGMAVEHPRFGLGTIVVVRGSGRNRTATIQFIDGDLQKTLRLSHAPLTPVTIHD